MNTETKKAQIAQVNKAADAMLSALEAKKAAESDSVWAEPATKAGPYGDLLLSDADVRRLFGTPAERIAQVSGMIEVSDQTVSSRFRKAA